MIEMNEQGTRTSEGDEGRAERTQQTISLPRHLRQRLRLAAVFLERQISDLAEEAVAEYLDRVQRDRKEQGLAPIPGPAPESESPGSGN